MAAAPREHGTPPVAAVLPFVAGADGVPRLPRITGAPPFTVKSAKNGKPGLDRGEFARQLTGQQDGLNRLTVAQFLANRGHYLSKAALTGDGRDPKGDAAQKLARAKALRTKVLELRREDRALSKSQATAQAQLWMGTQAALHNPDQVAGGHADTIAGLGDARVNSAIGAQWPKRIKAIDEQVRRFAAAMSPAEQKSTYLNMHLPLA